jgi:hypothetical protein
MIAVSLFVSSMLVPPKEVAMNILKCVCGATVLAAGVVSPSQAADSAGGTAKIDIADCAGFTAKDAAPFLGVPAAQVVRHKEAITKTLVTCSFAPGKALPGIAFSIEIEATAKKSAEQMERYRDNLMTTGDTAPWKGKLPKGAYSDIMGPGLGDEAVWTDINGALTVRKLNVTVQFTRPAAKLDQVKVAQAVLAKF